MYGIEHTQSEFSRRQHFESSIAENIYNANPFSISNGTQTITHSLVFFITEIWTRKKNDRTTQNVVSVLGNISDGSLNTLSTLSFLCFHWNIRLCVISR